MLKILREEDCSCQCGMKTAECIMKDPNCSYSRAMAKIAIQGVKDGKSLIEISKLMDASPKAHRPKLLEAPGDIAVDGAPVRGPADARITLVEFSDFECPFCSAAVKQVDIVMAAYPKDVKLIYKQFPLSMHPHAELAAEASLAAREQGKFWEMYDVLFKNFRRLSREQHPGHGARKSAWMWTSSRPIWIPENIKAMVDKGPRRRRSGGRVRNAGVLHQRQAVQRRSDAGRAEADSRGGA